MKLLFLLLVAEPFLLFLRPYWHPFYFHTFITPVIIVLIGLAYLQRKDKSYIEFRLPSLFFAWVFLLGSYRFVGDILARKTLNYWPLLPMLSLGIFLALYYVLTDVKLSFIDNFIAIAGTIMVLLAFLQIIEGYHPHKMIGTLGNPTNLGIYLAISWPYTAEKRYLWSLPLLVAIGLSNSASAVLGVMVAIMVYLFLKKRWMGIFSFLIFLVLGLIFVKYNPTFLNLHGKAYLWQRALEIWQRSWLIGFGPGSFEATIFYEEPTWWVRPHSLPIHILFESGVIGFLIFSIFCVKDILLKAKNTILKKKAFASIMAFGVMSLGSIPHHIWPVCVILAISLAILKKEA